MKRSNYTRIFVLGIISWVLPFVISFLFYKPGGELAIPYDLFKSILLVVSSITGAYLLYRYFITIKSDYRLNSLWVGGSWLAINILLDLLLLLPIMKISLSDYFSSIGLRYLIIPVFAYTIGSLLAVRTNDPH